MILITIIVLGSIINASTITVDQYTVCQCNQILSQDSCNEMGNNCFWQNNICNVTPCSCVPTGQCQTMYNCYQNTNGKCLYFYNCQDLVGNSISSCQTQNANCFWVNGTNCTPISSMSCGQFTTEAYCTQAGNGLCFWYASVCNPLTSCSQLQTQQTCLSYESACAWIQASQSCQATTCELNAEIFLDSNYCPPILLNTQNLQSYQVCVLSDNYTTCVNGNSNQISSQYCLSSTLNTYYWNTLSNQCVACHNINFDQLLGYVMGMMILQILI